MKWFRLYDTVLDDPKVQRLKPELFKAWINLLCIACKKGGTIPVDPTDLGFMLRCDATTAERWLADLTDAGLIEREPDAVRPHQWDEYQYTSDCSTERSRRSRAKKRSRNPDPDGSGNGRNVPATLQATARDVAATSPESESESESEKSPSDFSTDSTTTAEIFAFPAGAKIPPDDLEAQIRVRFAADPAHIDRIIARAPVETGRRIAYLRACLAEKVQVPKATPPTKPNPQPAEDVWVPFGTPAWDAWDAHKPTKVRESKYRPGELGRWCKSEYPPQQEGCA